MYIKKTFLVVGIAEALCLSSESNKFLQHRSCQLYKDLLRSRQHISIPNVLNSSREHQHLILIIEAREIGYNVLRLHFSKQQMRTPAGMVSKPQCIAGVGRP